jgi:ethanolaminephosphotransferase
MNAFLINFIPMWLAPNTITLLGLCSTLSSLALSAYYSPHFDQTLPTWLYIYAGISIFIYQTLDNLDGRQARRTGSSSPLGLLFDHGVDALNCSIAAMLMAAVFQFGVTHQLFILWVMAVIPFVFATWEEYFTGQLILAEVNGPTDGLLLCVTFCFTAAAIPNFWILPIAHHIPALAGTAFGALATNWMPI